MSVAEMSSHEREFERTPPHDLAAEQCVLGSMLLSQNAIAEVIELIHARDFYRPAHQVLYERVLDLYGRGDPVDAITVKDELLKRGELSRVGDAPYLHTLVASVPTAANAGYYAKIVEEKAILRRLVEAGTRIAQLGYSTDGASADDLLDRAQAEVYSITDRRTGDDYAPLSEIMPGTLDEIEAIGSRGGQLVGVPTGFADLDALTNGLHPGQMIIIAARPAIGKALALDTPLPTPDGWTTMGEVRVGDELIGADGRPTRVVAATPVQYGRPCYEVEFDDGTVIVADAAHRWSIETGRHRSVKTTEEIAQALNMAHERPDHAVPVAAPLCLPDADLPFPPYALGVWLGAGQLPGTRIATADSEIIGYLENEGVHVDPDCVIRSPVLRGLGVSGSKHIPMRYLRASQAQRRALLAGLLDTRGHVDESGTVEFVVADRGLASDTLELVLSLGYRATMRPGHRVTFTPPDKVFRVTRKLARQLTRERPTSFRRSITDVRAVPSVPVRCVQVDSADRLYLAGRSWIPTHNSTLALDLARAAAIRHQLATVVFSLEMSRNEITMRLLSAEARVALHSMRSGSMNDEDWTRLARRMSEVAEAPLFIDDSPNMSMMEIRAKCRRLKQQHDLRMVIVDYLQLMSSGRRVESRQVEVSEFSRSLKLLAKELEVPVIALSQLNRSPEQRTDKKPMVSDLRESGCLTTDTRLLRADTGAEISLGELMATGARDIPVWSLDERLKLVPRTLTHAFTSGVKEAFRVRLSSGREVFATANHPFLTYDGWVPLGELTEGARVAVPRHLPVPLRARRWPEPEVILLAHLIGNGTFARHQPISYAGTDEADLAAVAESARHFGVTAIRDSALRLPAPDDGPNPIVEWLDSLGVLGIGEKFIPDAVFSLPNDQIALFLRHLWATGGTVTAGEAQNVVIGYRTGAERLARDVQALLLRLDVNARLRATGNGPRWMLEVHDRQDKVRFLRRTGAHGPALHALTNRNDRHDTMPAAVCERVRRVMAERAVTVVGAGPDTFRRGSGLGEIAGVLRDVELEMQATNDILWDEIVSIHSVGERPVYDATVMGTHNFVANGISLKNSIEQDADVVILLHREDAYEKESPRAGEADLIVAKHRNGPTATVTVAFQGHYSRFVDMAH